MSGPSAALITDKYGRRWALPRTELCPVCKQPDNCGDCNHEPLTDDEAKKLGAWK